jgi:hypothetical protein
MTLSPNMMTSNSLFALILFRMFLLGLLRALASSAQTPMIPFRGSRLPDPRSLLGLAVPVTSPLVRRDEGNSPRDGLVEAVCERGGSAEVLIIASLGAPISLEMVRDGRVPEVPDAEVITETGEVAVVALSMADSCLTVVLLARASRHAIINSLQSPRSDPATELGALGVAPSPLMIALPRERKEDENDGLDGSVSPASMVDVEVTEDLLSRLWAEGGLLGCSSSRLNIAPRLSRCECRAG